MTRERIFGCDVPFMAWMRANPRLASYSIESGIVQTDVDTTIHRYLTAVDKKGRRQIQSLMELEVKTRGGDLTKSQLDTYRKKHATTITGKVVDVWGSNVRNFGVSVLKFSGISPDDSEKIEWGRFDKKLIMKYRIITKEFLEELLLFELHPDTFEKQLFRRHHKTCELIIEEHSPLLGCSIPRRVIHRS